MSVLVTGGAGFIGSHTVELLMSEGYEVYVLDNFHSGKISNLSSVLGKVTLYAGDMRDDELVKKAVRDADYIIHLAAIVSVDEALRNPVEAFNVNALATTKLLEFARIFDTEKIVYASSSAVYGEPVNIPISETHATNPINPYGASKLSGEALMRSYNTTYGTKTISLRYFNVYGPRMIPGPYAGVISKFIEAAKNGKPLMIYGDGNQTRDFVYVLDVAKANLIALKSNETGVFNIGTGKETKIIDLAKLIIDLTESNSGIIFTDPRPGDIYRSVADITKAKRYLNWEPNISLKDGLRRIIEFDT